MENHGVIGNYMWEEAEDRHFELPMVKESTYHPNWWDKAESFFITAEKQVRAMTSLVIHNAIIYICEFIILHDRQIKNNFKFPVIIVDFRFMSFREIQT